MKLTLNEALSVIPNLQMAIQQTADLHELEDLLTAIRLIDAVEDEIRFRIKLRQENALTKK